MFSDQQSALDFYGKFAPEEPSGDGYTPPIYPDVEPVDTGIIMTATSSGGALPISVYAQEEESFPSGPIKAIPTACDGDLCQTFSSGTEATANAGTTTGSNVGPAPAISTPTAPTAKSGFNWLWLVLGGGALYLATRPKGLNGPDDDGLNGTPRRRKSGHTTSKHKPARRSKTATLTL